MIVVLPFINLCLPRPKRRRLQRLRFWLIQLAGISLTTSLGTLLYIGTAGPNQALAIEKMALAEVEDRYQQSLIELNQSKADAERYRISILEIRKQRVQPRSWLKAQDLLAAARLTGVLFDSARGESFTGHSSQGDDQSAAPGQIVVTGRLRKPEDLALLRQRVVELSSVLAAGMQQMRVGDVQPPATVLVNAPEFSAIPFTVTFGLAGLQQWLQAKPKPRQAKMSAPGLKSESGSESKTRPKALRSAERTHNAPLSRGTALAVSVPDVTRD